jgi:hypothetical protein
VRTEILSAREALACAPNKISVGARGVLFFGSFFCTSKRNEQKKQFLPWKIFRYRS